MKLASVIGRPMFRQRMSRQCLEAPSYRFSPMASRQIPLGPVDETQLPADLQPLLNWAADGVSLAGAAQHDQDVLNWLTQEYSGK